MALRAILISLSIFLTGCGGDPPRFTEHSRNVLDRPDRVEVFRLSGFAPPKSAVATMPVQPERFMSYNVLYRLPDLNARDARHLASMLKDRGTYSTIYTACLAMPGVGYRLWRGDQSNDVAICFKMRSGDRPRYR